MKNMTHNAAPLEAGPSGLALPTTAFSRAADRVITWFGELASALWLVLVLVIVVQVIARYVFGAGSIMMEELQWHLYAMGFMLGISFTEVKERNVRIDVLAERFTQRTRQWIELFGLAGPIGIFGVGLRTDRHIFARGHRHRTRHEARNTRHQYGRGRSLRRRHTHNQTGGRNDAIVRAKDGRTQPADAVNKMRFLVPWHVR